MAEENIFVVLRLMCLLSVTQARPPYCYVTQVAALCTSSIKVLRQD